MQILSAFCVQGRFRLTAEVLRFQLKLEQWDSIISDRVCKTVKNMPLVPPVKKNLFWGQVISHGNYTEIMSGFIQKAALSRISILFLRSLALYHVFLLRNTESRNPLNSLPSASKLDLSSSYSLQPLSPDFLPLREFHFITLITLFLLLLQFGQAALVLCCGGLIVEGEIGISGK